MEVVSSAGSFLSFAQEIKNEINMIPMNALNEK
jgi:hypothetical protein